VGWPDFGQLCTMRAIEQLGQHFERSLAGAHGELLDSGPWRISAARLRQTIAGDQRNIPPRIQSRLENGA
jgi:hypothetical protein